MKQKAILVCLWLAAPAVAAQPEEIARLRQQLDAQSDQMRAMAQRIESLEKLVAGLAGSPPPAKGPQASAPPPKPAEAEPRTRLHISGFADFTSIYRSAFTATGISTGFGSIPLDRAPESQLGEFRGTASHSRLSFRLDTKLGGRDLTAYAETDFHGAAQPNAFAGSNPHPLRMRLYWVQWRSPRWELLGGQSWSLLALNRRGISPIPGDIMSTQLIDPNYNVGMVWTRQATIRVTRKWDRWTAAAAIENPEQNLLDPRQVPPGVLGLFNRTTPGSNLLPDVVVKLAYDTPAVHLEGAAITRGFQAYSSNIGVKSRAAGMGTSLSGVIHAGRRVDLVSQNYVASGGGRYAQGLVPDVVVRPDGRLVRVFTASFLEGVEMNLPAGWQVYGYYGVVYGRRAVYRLPNGTWVGFGAPTGSAVDNRTVAQTTAGFRHTFWREDGRGALSYAINYSYLTRKLWEAQASGDAGHAHMLYTSFRYNLP